jgi:hypothetical protein
MNYEKPERDGFYWCKPKFRNVAWDMEEDIKGISIAQVVTLSKMSMGSHLFVRFLGHKVPHSINSPVIEFTLWGDEIKKPKQYSLDGPEHQHNIKNEKEN